MKQSSLLGPPSCLGSAATVVSAEEWAYVPIVVIPPDPVKILTSGINWRDFPEM